MLVLLVVQDLIIYYNNINDIFNLLVEIYIRASLHRTMSLSRFLNFCTKRTARTIYRDSFWITPLSINFIGSRISMIISMKYYFVSGCGLLKPYPHCTLVVVTRYMQVLPSTVNKSLSSFGALVTV